MAKKRTEALLTDLLALPTAPFTEGLVRQYLRNFCTDQPHVDCRSDAAGNILVHYKHPASKIRRPVCFAAHTDHPGFRALRMTGTGELLAEWHGGVPPEYFPNAKVRFWTGTQWVHGRITKTQVRSLGLIKPQPMVHQATIALTKPKSAVIPPKSPGMWDFPDHQIKKGMIYARGCDDIAGCAAMVSCLDQLIQKNVRSEAYFLFTRAEEVGFIGAIAACRLKTIPQKCLVVAIETSSVLPGVVMGGGPILRVGDKASIFTAPLTAWCGRVAEDLQQQEPDFKFQRKLMDGGTCESTAYVHFGYDATGLCLALGNYHNVDRQKKVLAPEYIHLDDYQGLVRWFVALCRTRTPIPHHDERLDKRLKLLEKRYQRLLMSTQ
ncbi:MAG: hypothetical protein HJJLKODD_01480 [Phycisphaerae bacterium]|nr:hypothetical protein [Phycisphaerae bacterium]